MPRVMVGLVALVHVLALTSCAVPPHWEKPGADASVTANDTSVCRAAARREAERSYPHGTMGPYYSGAGAIVLSQQRADVDRAFAEERHFNQCMQGKGYRRSTTRHE